MLISIENKTESQLFSKKKKTFLHYRTTTESVLFFYLIFVRLFLCTFLTKKLKKKLFCLLVILILLYLKKNSLQFYRLSCARSLHRAIFYNLVIMLIGRCLENTERKNRDFKALIFLPLQQPPFPSLLSLLCLFLPSPLSFPLIPLSLPFFNFVCTSQKLFTWTVMAFGFV